MQQKPSEVGAKLLELKAKGVTEDYVLFAYIMMKIYFAENPDQIQKAVRFNNE